MRDGHHILHNRQEWSLRPEASALRETPSLIPRIDREVHNEIHRVCPAVPLLGYHALLRTRSNFEPTGSTMKDIDNLQYAIEDAIQHPRSHPIERGLGDLALWAIDLQKPILKEELEGRTHLWIVPPLSTTV